MKPILISLSPNTEPDDVRLAWRMLWRPSLWDDQSAVMAVEQKLAQMLGCPALMMSSGRSGLYHLLSAANIGHGDEVIVQAFTCITVPAAVQWTGADPIYADIYSNTYNFNVDAVAAKITERTRAIIVQNTFGIQGPITRIKELVRGKNILVIEDLAHGLGASLGGAALGTLGDAAVISFGRDKALSSVFGGAVVSSHTELMTRLKEMRDKLPDPATGWVMQQLLHPISMSFIVPKYFSRHIGKMLLVALQKIGLLSKAVSSKEKLGEKPPLVEISFSPALAPLVATQLDKLARYTKRRRAIASQYRVALTGLVDLPENAPAGSWLRFPIRVPDRAKLLNAARQEQIMLGDWYNQVITPCDIGLDVLGYEEGSCPVAETAAREVVNLPTYPNMTDEQVAKVIEFVKSHVMARSEATKPSPNLSNLAEKI